ncbi:MAG TPA: hypothetical protein VFT66_08455 [Roseiflexaceae bacterium]|jgi:hypothetical protein|nr:hypothetical protein [Roseiflexaceae bacterium]
MNERDYVDERHDTPIEWWRHRVVIPTLVTLLVLSLLLHALTFASLLRVRSTAIGQLDAFNTYIGQVQQDTISVNIPLNQPVPIHASIPINQQLTIPIKTTVPISQSVNVSTPLGTLPLPIQMNFPVNLQIPIAVSQTVDVSTTITLNTNVPISVPVSDTPLAKYLQQLRESLQQLSSNL